MMARAMSASPSVFTLEAVNSLVPRLNSLMGVQMGRRLAIEERLGKLAELVGSVPDKIQLEDADTPPVRALKRDLVSRVDEYQSAWRELEDMGAVLKDPRTGLVDFYGQVDGKFVWLCWRYGEDAVTHYHALDEGFAGRKPIEPTVRLRHLN
jgi:hypothetical protein